VVIPVNAVAERLLELLVIKECYRPLTEMEQREYNESLQWMMNYMWRMATLKNLSMMAHMSGDTDWLHEICAEIERLES